MKHGRECSAGTGVRSAAPSAMPWTVKQEFSKQSEQENRTYYEPRCIEGNYGLPGLLHGRRMEEFAFAERRGPDPATIDNVKGGFLLEEDPLR
jgi:hypothetical protein